MVLKLLVWKLNPSPIGSYRKVRGFVTDTGLLSYIPQLFRPFLLLASFSLFTVFTIDKLFLFSITCFPHYISHPADSFSCHYSKQKFVVYCIFSIWGIVLIIYLILFLISSYINFMTFRIWSKSCSTSHKFNLCLLRSHASSFYRIFLNLHKMIWYDYVQSFLLYSTIIRTLV